ncbi:hypothetical protein AB1Y20_022261 [Prymnesium parvum]|uniref:Uncharacterized protein n=1 Tax=Prymnesium parvum TaxID=97485 RepID=A0AB34JHF6_PRYPA
MTGAARTLSHPLVLHSAAHFLLAPLSARFDVRLFAVLSTSSRVGVQGDLNPHWDARALAALGANRTRLQLALRLLRAEAFAFREDLLPAKLPSAAACAGAVGAPAMFQDLRECGAMLRRHEQRAGVRFEWVVRTRADAVYSSEVRLPAQGMFPTNAVVGQTDDSFAIIARDAVPAYFLMAETAGLCIFSKETLEHNGTLARLLPPHLHCHDRRKAPDLGVCIIALTLWYFRLPAISVRQFQLATNSSWGRRFARACHCTPTDCATNWTAWHPVALWNVCVFWPLGPRELAEQVSVAGGPLPEHFLLP